MTEVGGVEGVAVGYVVAELANCWEDDLSGTLPSSEEDKKLISINSSITRGHLTFAL
jgi:hypothetical protein